VAVKVEEVKEVGAVGAGTARVERVEVEMAVGMGGTVSKVAQAVKKGAVEGEGL
jgi:hypothetical protein